MATPDERAYGYTDNPLNRTGTPDYYYELANPDDGLVALWLSSSTIAEDAMVGAVVGAVQGRTSGSTLALTGTAGGKFALSGTNVVTAAALDHETAASHPITLTETLASASNSPRATTIAITVGDVAEGGGFGPFTLAWTSAATELTNLTFTITPAPLENDNLILYLDDTADMSSPFDGSDVNTVSAAEAVAGSITFTGIATPLTVRTTYARVNVQRAGADIYTNIVPKTLTAAGDTTAPVLSSPTGTKTGATTATLTVSTTEANGTLYGSASASPPSKAQIKLGQTSTGAASSYAFNQAVTATGVQTKNATGLTASTSYTMHYMHEDAAGNQSNVASASSFTTDAAGGGAVAFDAASQHAADAESASVTWLHTPVGAPTGVVVALTYWQPAQTDPTSVTYGGVAMTLEVSATQVSRMVMYSLANPPAGPQNIVATWSSGAYAKACGAVTVTGGSTTDVLRTLPAVNQGNFATAAVDTVTVPSAATEFVVDVVFAYTDVLTIGAGQTSRASVTTTGNQRFAMSTEPGAASSVAMSWNLGVGLDSKTYVHVGASFNPA